MRCVEDERCSASFPHAFAAVLRVTTRTGHDNAVRSLPEERAAELAARTLALPALPDAQSVEDLTALLTSAGER